MNQNEFKQLTYELVPKLKEHFKSNKDNIEVRILQDTLNSQSNPFNQPSLMVGIGYQGENVMELYQVVNNGDVCEYKFAGNTRV